MTSILSETLAPPRIATNGRSGCSMRMPEVLELLLHEQSRGGLRQVPDHAFDRGVGAVSRPERVVSRRRRRARRARRQTRDRSSPPPRGSGGSRAARRGFPPAPRRRPWSRVRRCSRRAKTTCRPRSDARCVGHRLEAVLRIRLSLRPAEVRGEDHRRIAFERVLDRGQRRPHAGVVADHPVLQRDVEVHADEDTLALQIEVPDREFHDGLRSGPGRLALPRRAAGRGEMKEGTSGRPPGARRWRLPARVHAHERGARGPCSR